MKDCKDIKELLSPFLAGEVEGREKAAVEAHLEACGECRSDLDLLKQTVAALRSVPELPPPAALLRAVRKEVSPEPARGFFRRIFGDGWVGIPVGALAMAVLGIAAFVLQDRYPELQQGPEVTAPRQTVTSAAEEKADLAVKEEAAAPPPAAAEPEEELRGKLERERPAAAPSPAPREKLATVKEAPPAKKVVPEKPAPASDREDAARLKAPAPPSDRPVSPAESTPVVVGGSFDDAAARDSLASRTEVPPTPSPTSIPAAASSQPAPSPPPAVTPPPAAAPPGDRYRSGEDPAEGMKDVRRLLESSELLSPGRRENGRTTISGVDDAPAGPTSRHGSESLGADRDGADESRAFGLGQAAAPEMKKSLKRKARTETLTEAALPAEDSRRGAAGEMDRNMGLEEFTEVLTLLSLRDDEMEALRRSIGDAGGQLLELKTLDSSKSRGLARPFEEDIPAGQTISRGWRVRALLPAGKVAEFIEDIEGNSRLRILNRTRTPAARRPSPGIRSLEIIVIR